MVEGIDMGAMLSNEEHEKGRVISCGSMLEDFLLTCYFHIYITKSAKKPGNITCMKPENFVSGTVPISCFW
jgi:hypothetical protein